MAAGQYSFEIEQGTTLDLKLIWKDSEGTAVPLSGYVARMQVRETKSALTTLAEFKTEDSSIELGPADGEIHIKADADTTAGWDWPIPAGQVSPAGVYDLELESASGFVTRLIEGTITLDPEVTR